MRRRPLPRHDGPHRTTPWARTRAGRVPPGKQAERRCPAGRPSQIPDDRQHRATDLTLPNPAAFTHLPDTVSQGRAGDLNTCRESVARPYLLQPAAPVRYVLFGVAGQIRPRWNVARLLGQEMTTRACLLSMTRPAGRSASGIAAEYTSIRAPGPSR